VKSLISIMKVPALLLGLLVASASGEESKEASLARIDSIPHDKCGATVAANEDDRVHVFSLSHDSALWHKYQKTSGGWSNWVPLGGKQKFSSGPSVVRDVEGRLNVFVRGADKTVYYTSQRKVNSDEAWTPWACFGGQFASAPVAVLNSQGYIEVYAQGRDNALYYKGQMANGTAAVWSNWHSLGAELTGPPAAAVDPEGMVHVFARGNDRSLWHKRQIATEKHGIGWAKWESLGGVLASSPHVPAVLDGTNLLSVYARAADKALWSRSQVATHNGGVAWGNWQALGGILSSGPGAALNIDGAVSVYSRATDKSMYYKVQTETFNGTCFGEWHKLGGAFSTGPTTMVRGDGLLEVYARGIDRAIWMTAQVESDGLVSFTPWKSLGGRTRRFSC
jgi:hypothetical protein